MLASALGLECVCVCAVGVAILGTTSNMAAQSFLYHQVRRASQSATSHFSFPQKEEETKNEELVFISSHLKEQNIQELLCFLVIHQDPIRRIPCRIPRVFHFVD
jgi:hypothetical protein